MSHDIESAWAATELVSMFRGNIGYCFSTPPTTTALSIYASNESGRNWPISDGVIRIESTGQNSYDVALEYKRENEGLHGVLTALGQAHSYIHKEPSGSIIVIPRRYKVIRTQVTI